MADKEADKNPSAERERKKEAFWIMQESKKHTQKQQEKALTLKEKEKEKKNQVVGV